MRSPILAAIVAVVRLALPGEARSETAVEPSPSVSNLVVATSPSAVPPPGVAAMATTTSKSAEAPATAPPAEVAAAFDAVRGQVARSLVQVVGLRTHESLRAAAAGSRRPRASVASGVLLDSDGYVVTTGSAVEQCDAVSVQLADGREARAVLLGSDPISDIVLLRIALPGLVGLPLAASARGLEGAWVMAVARTRDRHPDQSFGTVRRRFDQPLASLLMLSNEAYPGYSGGAAVNAKGELVGLVVGRLDALPEDWTESASSVGTESARPGGTESSGSLRMDSAGSIGARGPASFAVAADDLRAIADELRLYGRVRRGYLGVRMVQGEVFDANAPDQRFRVGVRVEEVLPGSPAAHVGLAQGDLIVGWNGETLQSPEDLMRRVEGMRPGESADLVWVRNEQRHDGRLVVGAKPDEEQLAEGDSTGQPRTVAEPVRRENLNKRLDQLRNLRTPPGETPKDAASPGTPPAPQR